MKWMLNQAQIDGLGGKAQGKVWAGTKLEAEPKEADNG